jgi:folylpolyglutamate synthase/dihydropteroate synthase
LAGLRPNFLAVQTRQPRSAAAGAIADIVSQHGLPVLFESEDTGEATRKALEMAGHDDLVLATGSLSVAAEVREEVKGIAPELYPYMGRPSSPGAARIM